MNIYEKTYNSTFSMSLEEKDFEERKIHIDKGVAIDSKIACSVYDQIAYLNSLSSDEPIVLFINSPGGEIDSGLLIYDAIQSSKAPIYTICKGVAYSMAAVIFAGATKGNRCMYPNSKLMLHEPLINSGVGGSSSSVKSISESLLEAKSKINEILSKHTGNSIDIINDATSFDNYFSPREAIDFGLADRIISTVLIKEIM